MNPRKRQNEALSHLSKSGAARMVDVGGKQVTLRSACAEALISLGPRASACLSQRGSAPKGNVLETARLAGIMAAKRTWELIPLCHPLNLDSVQVEAEMRENHIRFEVRVKTEGKTGVEMEALTAAAVAALTAYDMVKSLDKATEIGPVRLLEKSGGKSGAWRRDVNHAAGNR